MKQTVKRVLEDFLIGFSLGIGALLLAILISACAGLSTKAILDTAPTYVAEAILIGCGAVFLDWFILN